MGFQRQLCDFEKLLNLKRSYSSPNRVNKMTAKLVHGTLSNYGTHISANRDESVLKSLSMMKGGPPAAANINNNAMFDNLNKTITGDFVGQELA